MAVEVDQLTERERVPHEGGASVLEALLVLESDRFAHVCGEACVATEKPGEDPLAEEGHVGSHSGRGRKQPSGASVGGEEVEMGVPLQEASRGGDRDDEAGAQVASGPTADELDGRFCARPGERGEEVSPAAKERPQQARDGQHHVAVSVISTPSSKPGGEATAARGGGPRGQAS